jgi:glycosyltransferase involved in cell wall biosynthesis
MKILILNYEFPPLGGGSSPVSLEIAKGYVKRGHSVDVVTMRFKGLPENEVIDGISVYRVKCIRMRKDICRSYEMLSYVVSALLFLNSKMKKSKYDICHCHFIIPTGIIALWLRKKFSLRYVLTTHGSDLPGYNPDRFVFYHKFTKPFLKIICDNAKQICSPSFFLKNLIKRKVGNYDVKHIPNGIDLSNFKLDINKPKEPIILALKQKLYFMDGLIRDPQNS